jgi:hypothetical protein
MPVTFSNTRMPWARRWGRDWEQELQRYSTEQQPTSDYAFGPGMPAISSPPTFDCAIGLSMPATTGTTGYADPIESYLSLLNL